MTRVLLDTQVLLWVLGDDARLGSGPREVLREADSVLVSAASLWELSIKHSIGKFPDPAPVLPPIEQSGLRLVSIEPEHVLRVRESPLPHRDPFDRLLLAQAQTLNAVLMTADEQILTAGLAGILDARLGGPPGDG